MATTVNLKSEIKQLIEEENDTSILKAIRTLLSKTSLDATLKAKLTQRALNSEEDIKKGNLHTIEDVMNRTKK